MEWAENNGVDYIFGLAGNSVLEAFVAETADHLRLRHLLVKQDKLRWHVSFKYQAKSWSRPRRVVARLEVSLQPDPEGEGLRQEVDIRYVVTSLAGSARHVYERVYCKRGQMENLIKLHKAQLASDRTSCHSATANQVRLVLHTVAFWLMNAARSRLPPHEPARKGGVRDDQGEALQDRRPRHRAHRAHPHSPANELPGAGAIPTHRPWFDAGGAIAGGALCPPKPPKGRSTTNALH